MRKPVFRNCVFSLFGALVGSLGLLLAPPGLVLEPKGLPKWLRKLHQNGIQNLPVFELFFDKFCGPKRSDARDPFFKVFRVARNGAKMVQDRPKMAQDRPKTANEGSKKRKRLFLKKKVSHKNICFIRS